MILNRLNPKICRREEERDSKPTNRAHKKENRTHEWEIFNYVVVKTTLLPIRTCIKMIFIRSLLCCSFVTKVEAYEYATVFTLYLHVCATKGAHCMPAAAVVVVAI